MRGIAFINNKNLDGRVVIIALFGRLCAYRDFLISWMLEAEAN